MSSYCWFSDILMLLLLCFPVFKFYKSIHCQFFHYLFGSLLIFLLFLSIHFFLFNCLYNHYCYYSDTELISATFIFYYFFRYIKIFMTSCYVSIKFHHFCNAFYVCILFCVRYVYQQYILFVRDEQNVMHCIA